MDWCHSDRPWSTFMTQRCECPSAVVRPVSMCGFNHGIKINILMGLSIFNQQFRWNVFRICSSCVQDWTEKHNIDNFHLSS